MKSDAINISLELELRRDRIGSWRAETDIISTGYLPKWVSQEPPRSTSVCLPVSQWMPVFPALSAFSSQTRFHPSFNGQAFMLTESPLLPKK